MNILHLPSTPIFDTINQFVNGPYGPIILWTGFIIALLNCFFGYTLRKIWGTLLGILIGGAIGVGGAIYFHQSFQIILIAGAIGAFFGGTTALALYRVGLFVLCAGLTFLGLYFFFPTKSNYTIVFYGIAAILVGVLSNIYEHIVIILATSLGGGIGAMYIFYLINGGNFSLVWIAGILIAFLGFLFQLKPWKEKGYWKERRNRDKTSDEEYRNRRRQKRKKQPSIPDRISSLFTRKKKTKKKQRSIYESVDQTPSSSFYDPYEEEYDYTPYDGTMEDTHADLEPNGSTPDSIPTEKMDHLEFDYSDLDPFDYAMEDKYSVKVDRSVFDKTQPDLSSPSIKPDATKTFSIPRNASTKAIELDSSPSKDSNKSDSSLY